MTNEQLFSISSSPSSDNHKYQLHVYSFGSKQSQLFYHLDRHPPTRRSNQSQFTWLNTWPINIKQNNLKEVAACVNNHSAQSVLELILRGNLQLTDH